MLLLYISIAHRDIWTFILGMGVCCVITTGDGNVRLTQPPFGQICFAVLVGRCSKAASVCFSVRGQ